VKVIENGSMQSENPWLCARHFVKYQHMVDPTFYFHEALDAVALDSVWHLLSKLLDNRTAMGTK
jgi:hypothetical protein